MFLFSSYTCTHAYWNQSEISYAKSAHDGSLESTILIWSSYLSSLSLFVVDQVPLPRAPAPLEINHAGPQVNTNPPQDKSSVSPLFQSSRSLLIATRGLLTNTYATIRFKRHWLRRRWLRRNRGLVLRRICVNLRTSMVYFKRSWSSW